MGQTKLQMGHVPTRTTVSSTYLRKALRQHIPEIKFGCRVANLVPHDGVKGDVHEVLAIGADGMCSTVRRPVYPPEQIGTSSGTLGMMQVDQFLDLPHSPPLLVTPAE